MSVRKALGLGAISGLRSASGPAFVSQAANRGVLELDGTRLAFLGSPRVSKALLLMALGEFVGDKLPMAPGRTTLPPLLVRAASGGLVGAALFVAEGRRAVTGAALGAPTSVAAAFAGEGLRVFVGRKTGVPNLFVALAEDAVVVLVGSSSLRNGR